MFGQFKKLAYIYQMKYTAIKLSSSSNGYDPTKSGFSTEDDAWEYIKSMRCNLCVAEESFTEEQQIFACDAEWMVTTDEEYLSEDDDEN